jgi:hypothetical protein
LPAMACSSVDLSPMIRTIPSSTSIRSTTDWI